jgi:hypothetical protein
MDASAMSVGLLDSHPVPVARSGRGPRLLWLGAFLSIAALTAARLPTVRADVKRRLEVALASGQLPDTTQRDLALNLGVAAALALSLTLTLVVLAVARRVEPRLRLPELTLHGTPVPGLLVVVWSVLAAKQVACLVSGATQPLTDPWVWAGVLAALTTAAVLLGRRATSRPAVTRTAATAVVVGVVALLL